MRRAFIGLVLALSGACFWTAPTHAAGLKLAPLEYRTTLKSGEKQRGFVDVSNPTKETLRVSVSTQAFRQIDDNGALEFFDDQRVSSGVLLDLDEFDLGPREAVRMYFVLDGTRLPTGDVYGAIFFTTAPARYRDSGVGQSVRLGTLLSITNGTPGVRSAEVKQLEVSFLQLGEVVRGSYSIKNTGDPRKTTGFYPKVGLRIAPFGKAQQDKGKLIFAGRTRENDFELEAPPFGFYRVTAVYGTSEQSTWVFVARPVILVVLAAGILVAGLFLSMRRRRARRVSRDSQ